MRRMTWSMAMVAIAVAIATGTGCSTQPNSVGIGTMGIHMTDAPGNFDAVNLVVTEVSASLEREDGTGGWEVLSSEPGTFDLLALRNGVFATLAVSSLPAGTYQQVRLKLGEGSTVVVDGVTHPLVIPSGLQSGLKLSGEFVVPAGGTQDIQLDFDAQQSISQNGAGDWILKPVVRVMPALAAGSLSGQISPQNTVAEVSVMQGSAMVGSAETDANGFFQVSVLPPGSYDVVIKPVAFYQEMTLPAVAVASGSNTDLGTIALLPPEF